MVINWVFCRTFFLGISLCFKNCIRASAKLLNNTTQLIKLKIKLINIVNKSNKKKSVSTSNYYKNKPPLHTLITAVLMYEIWCIWL